jgi:hypothetical protein
VSAILGEFTFKKPHVRPPNEWELSSPEGAYEYAATIVDGPWPEGEPAIATDGYWSCMYARFVLGRRFVAGEDIIASTAPTAIDYARYVIKGPWLKGEPAIMAHDTYKTEYLRFLVGECHIPLEDHFAERIASGEIRLEDVYGE